MRGSLTSGCDEALGSKCAYPAAARDCSDNDPELACAAMADWAGERTGLAFIPPGLPWRNGYTKSFNATGAGTYTLSRV